jgi:hypothetical protein
MKTRYIVAFLGMIFLLIVGICGRYIWIAVEDWASSEYDPSTASLQIVDSMLQAIATQTSEADVTVEPWEVAEKECKDLLQSLMLQNNNQYTLTVYRIYGNYGTPIFSNTGSDEVLLHVDFPDGSRVELYFYNAILSGCRKIID